MNCLSGRVSEFVETAAFDGPAAGAVDVLDAQQEAPARSARADPGEERRMGMAEV